MSDRVDFLAPPTLLEYQLESPTKNSYSISNFKNSRKLYQGNLPNMPPRAVRRLKCIAGGAGFSGVEKL